MAGTLIIWISFAAALASSVLHVLSIGRKSLDQWARWTFAAAGTGVVVAAALLLTFILQHRFEYAYIAEYSSRDLPLSLLVTTFWAGQQGSFMLWALFSVVIGAVLLRSVRQWSAGREAMAVYIANMAFLLLLLSAKSPFQYVWDAYPKEMQPGFIPQDGRGLNPLLQNFWMIIHPPVLFVGFAALAVPFSFAVAALWRKALGDWVRRAIPWILFAALSLGAGLILGGYWAYGVLGWGGWWGWDPVENSSLLPWIVSVILLHTMVVQNRTGRLPRTNFVLAILSFLLVVYSTFLTRSGVLAEASVHSFVDPGRFAYALLLVWLAGCAIAGFGALWIRRKDLASSVSASAWLTRESMLSIASIVMGMSAVVILFGTSWPLLSPILGKVFSISRGTVEPAFYDRTNLPLAVLMTALLGLSLRFKWTEEMKQGFVKALRVPVLGSVAGILLLVLAGLRDVWGAILAWASLFALIASVEQGIKVAKERPWFLGGALAHSGLAILLLGIIASGRYGEKQSVSLPQNKPTEAFGYSLTYTGSEQLPDGKWKFSVRAEKDGSSFVLEPVMFESSYNNSLMRNPDYVSFLVKDFYLEPVSLEQGSGQASGEGQQVIELTKGETQVLGPMELTFVRFDMSPHAMTGEDGKITIGAVLEVKTPGGKQEVIPQTSYARGGAPQDVKTAYLKNSAMGFQLLGMNIDPTSKRSMIQVNIVGLHGTQGHAAAPPVLVAEVSVKPFMSFVWAAAVLLLAGLALAMTRRLREKTA